MHRLSPLIIHFEFGSPTTLISSQLASYLCHCSCISTNKNMVHRVYSFHALDELPNNTSKCGSFLLFSLCTIFNSRALRTRRRFHSTSPEVSLHLEYSTKVRTSFSKFKIMQIAIRNSTKKCGVLVDQCLSYKTLAVHS